MDLRFVDIGENIVSSSRSGTPSLLRHNLNIAGISRGDLRICLRSVRTRRIEPLDRTRILTFLPSLFHTLFFRINDYFSVFAFVLPNVLGAFAPQRPFQGRRTFASSLSAETRKLIRDCLDFLALLFLLTDIEPYGNRLNHSFIVRGAITSSFSFLACVARANFGEISGAPESSLIRR